MPGCGKSTISHKVAEKLRKQGKSVSEPTYDTDHRYIPSVRKGVKLLKLVKYALFYPNKYKKLCKLIRANGHSGLNVLSQAANIAPKLWAYDHSKVDFVIFDEGLTQSAISLVINSVSSLENEKTLYELSGQKIIKKFYIKVSNETALLRMAGRTKHDSRIEKISVVGDRLKAMRRIERLCESVPASIIVDTITKEESVSMILRQIS